MSNDQDGCETVSGCVFLLVPAYPGCPGPKAVKRLCVCVCVWIYHRVCDTQSLRHTIRTMLDLWLPSQLQKTAPCCYSFPIPMMVIHGSLGTRKFAPQNGISIGNRQTDRETDHASCDTYSKLWMDDAV